MLVQVLWENIKLLILYLYCYKLILIKVSLGLTICIIFLNLYINIDSIYAIFTFSLFYLISFNEFLYINFLNIFNNLKNNFIVHCEPKTQTKITDYFEKKKNLWIIMNIIRI